MAKKESRTRPPYLTNLIVALVLATIVFIGIFILGYTISYNKYQGVLQTQEELRYSLLSFEVERLLINDSCDNFDPYLFSEDMDNMGSVIGLLEERLGKTNAQVLEQKKIYSLLEARHFLYIVDHNKKCKNKVNTILFFYSNSDNYKDESEKLGFMLSSLKNNGEQVMIYSFDYDLKSSLINILKTRYKLNSPNSLIINEKNTINVFDNAQSIKDYLKSA